MALGLPQTPSKGDSGVCQSRRHGKRKQDDTTFSTLGIASKRNRTLPSSSPTPDGFANAWQSEYFPDEQMIPHPMRGSEIHFTDVDYNSPASTVEEHPVSPKSGCSQTPIPMETDNNHGDWLNTANNFAFNPNIDWPASTPFVAFPEEPPPSNSFQQDSLKHHQASWLDMLSDVDGAPLMSPLGQPSGPPSSTNGIFGSPIHHSPMQVHGGFAWCYCGACRAGQPHGFHHHRHASGWRRPSSMTLPACYQDHMYAPCHDAFMAPLSAPLPPQPPLWHLNAQQQPMHTGPQSPSVPVWPQDCRVYSNQAIPQFAPGPANSPCANAAEAGWNRQLPFRGENPLSFHESNAPMPTSDQGLTQTAGADTKSWVHDLDEMAIDASNWYI